MNKTLILAIVILFTVVSCTPAAKTVSMPTEMVIFSTSTLTPVSPTAIFHQSTYSNKHIDSNSDPTPMKELTVLDVGLPIGPENKTIYYKKCYVWTKTRFHAGDLIYYEFKNSPSVHIVYAPIDGTIRYANKISNSIGWEIRVETPFVYKGEVVWYDIVHHDGPIAGLSTGSFIKKGEPLANLVTARNNGRIEKVIDVALRNGPRGPEPSLTFYPKSYMNFFTFVEDDLAQRNVIYETCQGKPIP